MRKNLQHLKLDKIAKNNDLQSLERTSMDGFSIARHYKIEDLNEVEHLDFGAGFAPYLRGSQTLMYVLKPWQICSVSSFPTIEQYHSYYKSSSKSENKTVFDLTQVGFTALKSDTENTHNQLIINNLDDFKLLFDSIPLNEVQLIFAKNKTSLPLISFFIATAQEKGIDLTTLTGAFREELLQTDSVSSRVVSDLKSHLPKFNSLVISAKGIEQSGASLNLELAYTLSAGWDFLRKEVASGTSIDLVTAQLSFVLPVGLNHFMEIAKIRAARMLWAKIIRSFNPKNTQSYHFKLLTETSNVGLEHDNTFNNVGRICIEAIAAIFAGTESLQTKNPNLTPTNSFSGFDHLSESIQIYIQEETKITKTVDPWAGSFYLERLTHEMVRKTWFIIQEIENVGGFSKAKESGFLNNKLKTSDQYDSNGSKHEVLATTIFQKNDSFKELPLSRNSKTVETAISKLTECARTGNGNLVELAVEAVQAGATSLEISNAIDHF